MAAPTLSAGSTPAPAASDRRWLFGPWVDLLLGCGLGYALWISLVPWLGLDAPSLAAAGLVVSVLLAGPHYGATLLRVYGSRSDFRKYRFFTVGWSALVWIAFVVGLHDLWVGSFLITLYFTWSPWHYTGQNYGVALMMLARRGIAVAPVTKRLIYASFVASYLLTFLAIHGARPAASYAPIDYAGALYRMLPLGIPTAVVDPLLAAVAVAYLGLLVATAVALVRAGSLAALVPGALVVLTQAMWFSVPVLLRLGGVVETSPGPGNPFSAYGFVWVAAAHSVQYLWITTYYATARGGRGRAAFLGKSALAGFPSFDGTPP